MNGISDISEGQEIKESVTVGEEFIEWAEKCWALDKLIRINNPDKFAGEVCDYNYMRKIFISKIDGIINTRLGNQ